jgi:hypothetical protein
MLEGPSGADFLVRIAAEDDLLLAASDHSPSAIATERVEEWSPPTFDGVVRTIDFAARSVELMSVETMSGPGTVNQPPSSGYLHFSFRPERSRLRRQRQALDRVTSGTAEMPFLGLLLEGRDPGNSARRDISTLSAATRRSFGAKPTAMQEEALRVALNTPDLALVQGPPGTGKTQVLSALQVRLAELDEDSGRLGQSTLLSSFQHDAVEHAVSRTSVLGLPAWKIGERSGTPSSSMSRPLPTLAQWRKSLVEAVRADLGGRDHPTTLLHRIDLAITRLTLELTTEEEQEAILHAVEAVVLGLIPATLVRRLADAIEAGERVPLVREREPAGITRAVEALKAIPCEPATFLPHGPELATKALLLVERTARAEPSLVEALAVLADWLEDEPPVTGKLDVVELIAENLATAANRDLPTPEPVGPSHTAERVEVLEEVREAVATYLDTTLSGAERALAHYAEDLELDDEGVERVMREYAVVLAATCQQAASKVMYETKGHDLRFENVIIDEAARANPLDLLIPLTLATRRVVLVGDHRQLPHLLEPDVEDAMAMDLGEDAAVALRASLFERLFEQLRELELRTGIKRVVTLDKQYRMHPILGQFVSEAFYGSPDAILAGRAAGEFAHKLAAYEGKVAAWADLPISRGPEKGRRSRERPCEAEWIAGEVVRISQENPSLTIGVVTFYAAQRSRLLRALKEREVVEETAEGYRMRREYSLRETPTGLVEPLRIGTVDAFQGMEFDVVILSVVRSNDYPGASERERRRKWGFLLLENRMCVAMSRQRRLLVVVGDPTMAEGSDASEAVPGLSRFRQLCLSEVGRVIRP